MKILLLGEYSNVHNTLAQGLRHLGHEVTVASDGDDWKNYPRDIDLFRVMTPWKTFLFLLRVLRTLPKLRGYDVVQLINPVWLPLKPERIKPLYRYIRKHNKKMVLGAFGMDYYWIHVNETAKPLRYSDFNFGKTVRTGEVCDNDRKVWVGTTHQQICEYVANDCDCIVAGLYEYYETYKNAEKRLADKTVFLPFPIESPCRKSNDLNSNSLPKRTGSLSTGEGERSGSDSLGRVLTIFVGISRNRSAYKGTDIMLHAARMLKEKYPNRVELKIAEGVPFDTYQHMMDTSDCILDQLYSYTPAMNALLAMSKGIIVVGGGEPENYAILDEKDLQPIVNVVPVTDEKSGTVDFNRSADNCFKALEELVLHPERIPQMKEDSKEYIRRHHDYIKVAQRYIDLYKSL